MTVAATERLSPYVGPRPFQIGEPLFGRDVETQRLVDLLIAERIVLLYSPSGAGKTSLIQAGLIPRLQQEEFAVLPGDAQVPVIRVNAEPPPKDSAIAVTNRYAFSTLRCLAARDQAIPPAALATMSLAEFLERRAKPSDPEVLIFDQFEEILTVDPTDLAGKAAFFDQLGAALRDRNRWALFSMREDHVTRLDPYLFRIPRRLATRFRLDLLGRDAALQAIQRPAERFGVTITAAAAEQLVGDLCRVRLSNPDGTVGFREGCFVEPVQLQVVCDRMWANLPAGSDRITEEDIAGAVRDVDTALADYYAERVARIAAMIGRPIGVTERSIRDWVEKQLIIGHDIRGQVPQGLGGKSGGLDNRAITALIDAHLVRAEDRHGASWYELAHDRLIEPIRKSNALWREKNLEPVQRRAEHWDQERRPDSFLLKGRELDEAVRWASEATGTLTPTEQEFLNACRTARALQAARVWLILIIAVILLCSLAAVAYATWQKIRADSLAAIERSLRIELALELSLSSMRQGLSLCENGNVGSGLICLADSLKKMPPEKEDFQRIVRTQLMSWRQRLPTLRQRLLPQHVGHIWAVAFSPDGEVILTGGEDKTARLWDANTGRQIGVLQHEGAVRAVAFSPDSQVVLTGSGENGKSEGEARLWNAKTRQSITLQHEGTVRAVAFSPDGRTVLTGSADRKARLWDVHTGRQIGGVLRHEGAVRAMAFSPGGDTVLTGGDDSTARLWDARTGEPIGGVLRHQGPVWAVAFSPDGQVVLTGSDDRTARLWNANNQELIGSPLQHRSAVGAVAFSPDGRTVLTGSDDKTARLWDTRTARPIAGPLAHHGQVLAVAFSPVHGGKTFLTGCRDGSAQTWDVPTDEPIDPIVTHQGAVRAVAFSPDHRTVLTGGEDKTARLWDARTGEPIGGVLRHQGPVWAMAFSPPDGRTVLTGSGENGQPAGEARLWDARTGEPIGGVLRHQGPVWAVAFSPPDRRTVLTGGDDKTARLWDARTGEPIGGVLRHQGPVWAVAFSPDGRTVLTGGDDKTARLWDARTGRQKGSDLGHKGRVWAVAFSPDGRTVLTGSDDETAQLWDATTGEPKHGVLQHQGPVLTVAFSPDGRTVLTGSEDKSARLWKSNTGEQVGDFLMHQASVRTVAFSQDNKMVLTGSEDNTARLWDARTGLPLTPPLVHQDWVMAVAFSPDGRTVLTGSADKTARLWKVPTLGTEVVNEEVVNKIVRSIERDTGLFLEKGAIRFLDDTQWQARRDLKWPMTTSKSR